MLEVIESGIFTTVQDMGRYGYQRYGVPVSGALDQFALRVANLLVGNAEGDALVRRTEAVIWASQASAERGGEPVSTAEFL